MACNGHKAVPAAMQQINADAQYWSIDEPGPTVPPHIVLTLLHNIATYAYARTSGGKCLPRAVASACKGRLE